MSLATARVSGALCAAALLAWAPTRASAQESRAIRPRTVYEDLQMFSQVLNQIRVNHPDSVDTHALFMAAVEGMVRAADPHSYVLPATRLSPEKEAELRAGRLVPIPLRFRYHGGAPVVASVDPNSRAALLGIQPGDELVAIDGEPVDARSEAELEIVLAGDEGTAAVLTFERRRIDGSLARFERRVEREETRGASAIPAALMLDDSTGYARVVTFAREDIANELRDALGRLERSGMRRLVLDLRDNGGGLLDEAAAVAGVFLPEGAIVFTTTGRKEELVDTIRVERSFWRSERTYPIVVLVNAGTASAAELVAGALQDHDRALVVGRPTFGKSLMMQGFPMTDGSVIVLVVGHVRTPCGRSIQREYRTISTREYYRSSLDERDRIGRPTCTTAGGRTVYGGGGIYPDVLLERDAVPLWLSRVRENALALRWTPGYVEANPGAFPDADSLARAARVPPGAVELFRAFARDQGIEIPDGAEADRQVEELLLLSIAASRWGAEGYFRVAAAIDPEIHEAVAAFDLIEATLGGT
ncbi:MAG TPA: S41 family peptidase [Longimicrobiales bacterium]